MASTYKVLGQLAPSSLTSSTLYTVPASTQAVISSIFIVNRGAAATFRVNAAVAGTTDANSQYLAYDAPITTNGVATIKNITLGATDVLRVYASTTTLSFSAFGVELT